MSSFLLSSLVSNGHCCCLEDTYYCCKMVTRFLLFVFITTLDLGIHSVLSQRESHPNLFEFATDFGRDQNVRDMVFHFKDSYWTKFIKGFYRKEYKIPTGSVNVADFQNIRQGDPTTNSQTLQVILQSQSGLDNLKAIYNKNYPMMKDVWLVHVDSNTDLFETFKTYNLDYKTMLFPFTFNNITETADIWEVYKVHINQTQVQVLPYGSWTPKKGLQVDRSNIWHRRANLQGLFFRITGIFQPPYVTKAVEGCRSSKCFQGTYPGVWTALQGIMNFTFALTIPEDRSWGALRNGSWNGMIGKLIKDEVDIAPVQFSINKVRSQVVDFLVPITESYQKLFLVNPADSLNWQAYWQPLTWKSWLALALIILILPVAVAALFQRGNEPDKDEFTLTKTYYFILGAMTIARPWSHTPIRNHNRIAFFTVILAGGLIFYHWEAMLISYLAVRTTVLPFRSIEELYTKTNYKLVVRPGTAYVDIFKKSDNPILRKVYEERIAPDIDSYPRGITLNAIKYILDNPGYALYENFFTATNYDFYLKCHIVAVPKIYFPVQFAYAIQKDSPYFDAFWYHMTRLKETGVFDNILQSHKGSPQVCPDFSGKPLNFPQCFTAFIFLVVGTLIGLLILCLERVTPRKVWIKVSTSGDRSFETLARNDQLDHNNAESFEDKLNEMSPGELKKHLLKLHAKNQEFEQKLWLHESTKYAMTHK